jgi:voltage-gated potassium channel
MDPRLVRRVLLIAGLLVLTLCIGTVGFQLVEGYSLFDAFYMTLITISTVGYQEVRPLSHAGRIFNSFLILFGVSATFFAVGALTQTIIELELRDRYGRRRRKRMITQLDDHFIVCGFGRVGRSASHEFQGEGVRFLVIDRNEQRVDRARSMGMLTMLADATRDDTLREAGVVRARGLIAALPGDAENLFIILSAKTLNPKLTVVTRASEEEAEIKLRRAGADTVFAPYTMAGRRLAHALLRPHASQFMEFCTGGVGPKIVMEQLEVAKHTDLASKSLREALLGPELGVIVVAIQRSDGRMLFNPPLETAICPGDVLILLGEQPKLRTLESTLTSSR